MSIETRETKKHKKDNDNINETLVPSESNQYL